MRAFLLATALGVVLGLAVPSGAEDPPKKLTEKERKELEAKAQKLRDDGIAAAGL